MDQLFGEYSGSSESEPDLALRKRENSKKTIADYDIQVNDDWYSSGSEKERKLPASHDQSEDEAVTPVCTYVLPKKYPSQRVLEM